jgi:hypothetical protein
MCGHYNNSYDNYWCSHQLNPVLQYVFWTEKWKRHHLEIYENCKKLGQDVLSADYVRRYMDAVSPLFPTGDINNITEEEIMDYAINFSPRKLNPKGCVAWQVDTMVRSVSRSFLSFSPQPM